MVVLKIAALGYVEKGSHTIDYSNKCKQITSDKKNGFGDYQRQDPDYQHFVGENFITALGYAQNEVVKYLNRFGLDPKDFFIFVYTEEVKDHMFWVLNRSNFKKYRLSDLEVI